VMTCPCRRMNQNWSKRKFHGVRAALTLTPGDSFCEFWGHAFTFHFVWVLQDQKQSGGVGTKRKG
jgi:hypothetical protein